MFVSFSSAEPFDIPDLPETPETPASTFQSVHPEKEKLARTVSSASALSSSFHFPVSRTNRYQLPHPEPSSHQRIRSVVPSAEGQSQKNTIPLVTLVLS